MQYAREFKFVDASSRVIAVATADANDTGFVVGALYRFTLSGAAGVYTAAACRWGSGTATAADGGAGFVVEQGSPIVMRATHTTLHAIRVVAVDGTLIATRIDEGP